MKSWPFGFQAVVWLHSDQISFGLLCHPKIHHRNYIDGVYHSCQGLLVSDRSMMVQVECLHNVPFTKTLFRPTIRCRQVCRPSHISQALGEVLFCCSVTFWYLHESWFLVIHLLHLSGAGWSWPAWDSWFTGSRAANLAESGLTSSHCFACELCRLSSWLLLRPSASNSLCACGIVVGSSLGSTPLCNLMQYYWWVTGNFYCKGAEWVMGQNHCYLHWC